MNIKNIENSRFISFLKELKKDYFYAFLAAIIAGLIIYYQMYSTGAGYADPFANMDRYYVNSWGYQVGRFLLPFMDDIQSGMVQPFLNTLLALVFYGIGNSLLAYLFKFKNKYLQILFSVVIVASPNVAISLNNYYMSEAFPLAYSLSILSVLILHDHLIKSNRMAQMISIACLVMSLGMYQSYLGMAFVLFLITLIVDSLQGRFEKSDLLHYLITAVAAPVLYFVIVKLTLHFSGTVLADLHGANDVSIVNILANLPHTIASCYTDFIAYFFQHTDLSANYFRIIPINILCFAMIIIAFVCCLVKRHAKPMQTILLCAGMVLIPLCCNIMNLIASESSMYLNSIGGMLIVLPVGISLLISHSSLFSHAIMVKFASVTLCILMAYSCTLQDNADISVMVHYQNQAETLVNRIWARVEEQYPDDISNETIAILGIPSVNPEFPSTSFFYSSANWYARIGMFWDEWDGASTSWKTLLRNTLGVSVNYCSHDEFIDIFTSDEYKTMGVYPADSSIQKINGIITVKLVDDWGMVNWK